MVSSPPRHTPYDGSARPFTIGLKPLDLVDWIEVDGHRERYLDEKERLWATDRNAVFAATDASRPAQDEVLAMLATHLPERFEGIYRRDGPYMRVGATRLVDLAGSTVPTLFRAARLVQEDLVLMERGHDGWRLTAASLSFPSSWSLAEKFDRPIEAIHAGVPEFGPGTRNALLINRIFDNLKPGQPAWRLNWSIYPDDDLHHPVAKAHRGTDLVSAIRPQETFLRVEKQTLRRLPRSGAICFTIRIYVDPLAALVAHGEGARLAENLRRQLESLTRQQLGYKGLTQRKAALIEVLGRIERALLHPTA